MKSMCRLKQNLVLLIFSIITCCTFFIGLQGCTTVLTADNSDCSLIVTEKGPQLVHVVNNKVVYTPVQQTDAIFNSSNRQCWDLALYSINIVSPQADIVVKLKSNGTVVRTYDIVNSSRYGMRMEGNNLCIYY